MLLRKKKRSVQKLNPLSKFESIPFNIYGEAIGDHLRSNLGIIFRPGIICGSIWGSFPVRGSFAGLYSTASTVQTSSTTALISSPKRVLVPVTSTTTNQIAVDASLSMTAFPSGFFSSCNIGNVHVYLGSKPNQGEK